MIGESISSTQSSKKDEYNPQLNKRKQTGKLWLVLFQASTAIGIIVLMALLFTIINKSFGYVLLKNSIDPDTLAINGTSIEAMNQEQLIQVIYANVSKALAKQLQKEKPFEAFTVEELHTVINTKVLRPEIIETWTLSDSLLKKNEILAVANSTPKLTLEFRSWLTWDFISSTQSNDPIVSGARTAIFGSLWTILIAIVFALPIGISAAIYLEEYATKNWINEIIQTNINNLAGVPSIIYGILGLAIFVRALEVITSGSFLGLTDPTTANGRTILSAGLTLGLLILPLVIINSQEAIKSVSNSLRQASYGLGATRWQTIWHHVLPSALPGILTGAILAVSRAIGETAPLVVIGASTFINSDPNSPFSKFTSLPIQIYQWTSRPQDVFRNLAAAAILVLLILLLSLNTSAILLRNRFSTRR